MNDEEFTSFQHVEGKHSLKIDESEVVEGPSLFFHTDEKTKKYDTFVIDIDDDKFLEDISIDKFFALKELFDVAFKQLEKRQTITNIFGEDMKRVKT